MAIIYDAIRLLKLFGIIMEITMFVPFKRIFELFIFFNFKVKSLLVVTHIEFGIFDEVDVKF